MTNISLLIDHVKIFINPLNAKLNPICYLLALLAAHPILHVSRIRVNTLTYRMFLKRTDSDLEWDTDYTDEGLS
jgi:hypothetical protein